MICIMIQINKKYIHERVTVFLAIIYFRSINLMVQLEIVNQQQTTCQLQIKNSKQQQVIRLDF